MKKESFDEKVGWGRMLLVGFQHVLTMCPGTIAVPLILAGALGLDEKETAFLVSANFFTSGIAILIQVLGIGKLAGSRYPIVLGSSFAPLSPMILIGKEYGMAALFGSVIASGAVIFLLSFFMDKILKLFPQVVVGTFVTLIGITLAPTALRDLAGGEGNAGFGSVENLILGLAVLIFILLVEKYGKVCHCFLVLPQERLQDVFYIWWILLPLRRQRYSSRFSLLLTECRNLSCGLFSL